jgi:phosphopantothenoylcysteine decarboxylase/phosphopantothenate--cysteine ligase
MVIAPLTCNTLSKMANGACDNLLMAVYLSATCPVAVAPAMDEDMWKHPSTQDNILKVKSYGNFVMPVNRGELASGLTGEGRMAEPEEILSWAEDYFTSSSALSGMNVLVTAGPTYEAIDPVRFIGNHSSGKMGIALAEEFKKRGATVHLVAGPGSEAMPEGMKVYRVTSAAEMYEISTSLFENADIAVMCAAVADYTPVEKAEQKIKKKTEQFTIELKRTEDILKALGTVKRDNQYLVGFALETNDERAYAISKLESKNADMIILNSLNDPGAGFGHNTNKITIFEKRGKELQFDTKPKKAIATDIVNTIISNINA